MFVLDEHVAVDCVADFGREVEERGVYSALKQKLLLSFPFGAEVAVHFAVWWRAVLRREALTFRSRDAGVPDFWRMFVYVEVV